MVDYKATGPSSERLSEEYLAINSCGIEHLSEIDRGSMRINGRVDYHILYIEKGVCHLDLAGETIPISAGNIVLFRPGEPQCYKFFASDQSISHYIHFSGTGCAELLTRLGIHDIQIFPMGHSGTYEEISAKMAREYILKRQHWQSYVVGCLYELLSLIARKYALRFHRISHESESRIGTACRSIYDNLASPPSVPELAAQCGLSVSRFCHLFSDVMGKAPNEFIISIRIDRARELLEVTDLQVQEIAEMVGFEDRNYFSRLFKDRVGCSPSAFRKQFGSD